MENKISELIYFFIYNVEKICLINDPGYLRAKYGN